MFEEKPDPVCYCALGGLVELVGIHIPECVHRFCEGQQVRYWNHDDDVEIMGKVVRSMGSHVVIGFSPFVTMTVKVEDLEDV